MSANRNRTVPVSNGKAAGAQPIRPRAPRPLPSLERSDVRPEKVAKAKQLIARAAYPNTKVVESLAEQIARFF